MEFNLKNRPPKDEWHDAKYDKKMEEWFEGFEKELRSKLKEHLEVGSIGSDIIAGIYKEILGDSEK